MSTFSAEVEVLSSIADLLKQGNQLFLSANSKPGSQKPEFKPYPRPKTAFDRAKQRVRRERHEALSARLLRRSTPDD